ncbi:hypothetical protein CR983_03265 [Candidatus Saccharibacteria bacterium]|nr:MAG: hypothetical protein CR983_03265 [Candidatus Saccharibacteria bacterium]
MLRLSRQRSTEAALQPGELRPQLAYLLNWLSEPAPSELCLDPFCGYGALAISRTTLTSNGLIMASDSDADKVERLKARVKQLGLKKRIVVRAGDATNLQRYNDNSIDRIVTDPPWGMFDSIDDLAGLYDRFLDEFYRVVKPGGIIVLLTARADLLQASHAKLAQKAELANSYHILVSGKKATVFKIVVR